ncbi:hypothetical protein CVCC1112_3122 [Paenarthrobacter nicotinovorans]|nr:hypothetical protein CVCC1112_3122 [Paenarthrobacter nicotinovorans]
MLAKLAHSRLEFILQQVKPQFLLSLEALPGSLPRRESE